jgi:predicted nucleic acid-binding protein
MLPVQLLPQIEWIRPRRCAADWLVIQARDLLGVAREASGYGEVIRELYGRLIIPAAVYAELLHPKTPRAVSTWAGELPAWVEVRVPQDATQFPDLGPGERQAIALALEVNADFLLIDETQGRAVSVAAGVRVKGTLGVLEEAAARRLLELPVAIEKLRASGIFLADHVIEQVLARHRDAGRQPT